MSLMTPIEITLYVADILENLDIPYAIGGSLASAIHGVMRATMDVDLVSLMRLDDVEPFIQALGDAFYADESMIRDAVKRNASFNILHMDTMFKVDVFIAKPRAFDRAQLTRRQLLQLGESIEQSAYVVSAEDIILAKLEWYKLGNQVSDRQWRDILGVLKIQDNQLDEVYLRRMAEELGVLDLLKRAFSEALS
ncbi:MAG: hypothetical protein JW981_02155 [Anaerolineae bacterium]|nr:hypothetical protein [Anaerolineae bacterium]